MRIVLTGGLGFVGRHLAGALRARSHKVAVFDSLDPQVHGRAEGKRQDVLDYAALKSAAANAEAVVHLAAAVGVGQSQYEIKHYVDVNVGGLRELIAWGQGVRAVDGFERAHGELTKRGLA